MKIAIIYNDPIQYAKGKTYDKESVDIDNVPEPIDMSEYGVLDEMKAVQRALRNNGHEPEIIPVALDIYKLVDTLRQKRPDLIFNLCESLDGDPDQEMNIASLFEILKIPYTGSRAFTLGLALNKAKVKEILHYHNIPTASHYLCRSKKDIQEEIFDKIEDKTKVRFPLIVKPSREDASIGINNDSIVYNEIQLHDRVEYVTREYKQAALVEEYIDGREINVSVVGNVTNDINELIVFPLSEIDFTGLPKEYPKIVSYNSKWMYKTVEFANTKAVCPAKNIPLELEDKIKQIARRVFYVMGASDYARVDFRLKGNTPYVLELNPNPDIASDVNEDTGFTRSGKAYGWSYDELIQRIVNFAAERWEHIANNK